MLVICDGSRISSEIDSWVVLCSIRVQTPITLATKSSLHPYRHCGPEASETSRAAPHVTWVDQTRSATHRLCLSVSTNRFDWALHQVGWSRIGGFDAVHATPLTRQRQHTDADWLIQLSIRRSNLELLTALPLPSAEELEFNSGDGDIYAAQPEPRGSNPAPLRSETLGYSRSPGSSRVRERSSRPYQTMSNRL